MKSQFADDLQVKSLLKLGQQTKMVASYFV
jgi:hypothetical protein